MILPTFKYKLKKCNATNIGLNTSGELEITLVKTNDHNINVIYLFVLTITFNGYLIISDFERFEFSFSVSSKCNLNVNIDKMR